MREFSSFIAPQLRAYLTQKTTWGMTSFAKDFRAGFLDHYVSTSGMRSFEQLNEDLILRWIDSIRHRSPASKNRLLGFVRGFFDYLVRHDYLPDNPARRILLFKANTPAPYIYSLREIQHLLEAARKSPVKASTPLLNHTLESIIFLIYACGLRISEAVNLKIQDVDFEQNLLSLWNTKFHKERLVPFSPAVAQQLRTYLDRRKNIYSPGSSDAPLFCHAKGKYSKAVIQKRFRQLLSSAGFAKSGKSPRIHDLRHTFAVHRLYKWYQEGSDISNKLPLLSTYMGHVTVANTQVYLRITTALLREGDRRFQAAFEDLAKKPIERVIRAP